MYSTLDVEIRPGAGLGMFDIGASLWSILDRLRQLQHVFPKIDIKYDPDNSAITPVVVHIRPHLDLFFSAVNQRLHTICIRRLRDPNPPVILRYQQNILSSIEEVLRVVGVKRAFGPTFNGTDLCYPGLRFAFDEDPISDSVKTTDNMDRMQEIKRVMICERNENSAKESKDVFEEVAENSFMKGDIVRAVIKVHDGVILYLYPTSGQKSLHIRIGETTAQDLLVDLGPPLRTYYKEDDRMKIHSTGTTVGNEENTGYFYNYFQHGIDFLLSGKAHVVKKIILHSNIPGTPLFQSYKRCNWEIEGSPEDDEDDTPPRKRFYDRFETISHFLSPQKAPASMDFDRTDEEPILTLPSARSHLYGYDGIVLEVTSSSLVSSVTLF
ncbi:hypothetical protein BDQ17DRAFT_1275311 [Cyathus striatus]|nr:hypothetical protein BDQ17DRAFT_1275311 [Cyathus striatus]